MSEFFILVLEGGIAGLFIALAGIRVLHFIFQPINPILAEGIRFNFHSALFAVGSMILVPLLFGIAPAIRASRQSPTVFLKEKTYNEARVSLQRLPLVVFEVAIATCLFVVCGLMVRSIISIGQAVPSTIPTAQIVTFTSGIGSDRDMTEVLPALSAERGVTAVGLATDLPLRVSRRDLQPLDIDASGVLNRASAIQSAVSPGFFRVLRLDPLQGTLPYAGEIPSGAVVSKSFAAEYGGDPLGMKIRSENGEWYPVVAIVRDWVFDIYTKRPLPTVYLPIDMQTRRELVLALTESGTGSFPSIRRDIRKWGQYIPRDLKTAAQLLDDQMAEPLLLIRIFTLFAVLSLLLSSIGVYGVMNFSASRRRREMGIRIAVGATKRDLFVLVLRETGVLMSVGIVAGWVLSIIPSFVLRHELTVIPLDPETGLGCSLVIMLTGLLAAYFPARYATRVDPVVALRSE